MGRRDSLVHQIAHWAQHKPNAPAIHGRTASGGWNTLTWPAYWAAVRETAKGLIALGHEVGDCVAIVGANRLEWVICQFGIMAARGVPAPIYVTNTVEQTAYVVSHSRSKIAICDTAEQLAKYETALSGGLMAVDAIVTMDDDLAGTGAAQVMSVDRLRDLGREQSDAELDKRLAELTDTETALLIYTSGTTGVPKAVQLEHGGMIAIAEAILDRMPPYRVPGTYRSVSYLPLCHVAEQLFTNLLHLGSGGEVYFCSDISQIKDHLVDVRPTFFVGVPRVWEKFESVLGAKLSEAGGLSGKLVAWSRRTELEIFKSEMAARVPIGSRGSIKRKIANFFLNKIRSKLGLDQLVAAATGAAPISVTTLEFFASLGITIYEGYGMSETTGVATCPRYLMPRFGTVGHALDGVEVEIAKDDEILLRGRTMTRGYLHMPEETAELIDSDGWLHTGDLGSKDKDGYLRITGRKKDLLITAGGKNVAPAELEAYMKQIAGVGQAVVVGDSQPFLCALLTLDPEALPALAQELGVANDLAKAADDPALTAYLTEQIERLCNEKVAPYQTIKKFKVLGTEFTVDSGEITPTMKIKRNVISDKYAAEIASFYEGGTLTTPAAQPRA